MKCKHENADHLMPGESMIAHGVRCWPPASVEQFRCIDCGAWLSIGPANDRDDTVQLEIRTLEYWLPCAPFDPDLDDCLCSGCQCRYLANAIHYHDAWQVKS